MRTSAGNVDARSIGMDNDILGFIGTCAFIAFLFFAFGHFIGWTDKNTELKNLNQELIDRELKHYDDKSGDLVWTTKLKPDTKL